MWRRSAVEGVVVVWVPEAQWEPVSGAGGSATRGVWRAVRDGQRFIVKRLEPSGVRSRDRRHHSWWRREAEVAVSGILNESFGLRPPAPIMVEEDEGGVTLWSPEVPVAAVTDEAVAHALGRFSSQTRQDPGWFTCNMLRFRIGVTDDVGGVSLLRDVDSLDDTFLRACEAVWAIRGAILDDLDQQPHVLSHGDALPRNMLRFDGENVVTVDWGQLGCNTIGADLATFCLYSTTGFDALLAAYCEGLRLGWTRAEEARVRHATVGTAALIAVSRAARAVAAGGDTEAYLGRLIRAEPTVQEAIHARRL